MEGNKAVLPGEEGMKALLGRGVSQHWEDAGGVVFLVVAAPQLPPSPPAARCFPKVQARCCAAPFARSPLPGVIQSRAEGAGSIWQSRKMNEN